MKRVAVAVVLAAVIAVAVGELGDLTQSRPDPVRHDAATEVLLSVEEDRFGPGRDAAADALWAVCVAQTSSQVPDGDGLDRLADGRYRAVLEPAVGHHERRKLVGCLEDLTIDRVLGDVESFQTTVLK